MFNFKKPDVEVYISKNALNVIFDECDRYDLDETGGRIIGAYQKKGNKYKIEVQGIIEPGSQVTRSATIFIPDREHQAKIFRMVEEKYPAIEHLGSWHTHHMNGLTTLSSGDRATYQRTVNHHMHNTDFYYALLVIEKKHGSKERYVIRHYFLRRNDDNIYEIPDSKVHITDEPLVWPQTTTPAPDIAKTKARAEVKVKINEERAKDQEFFEEFHPNLKPLLSKKTNVFYWKGKLDLIGNTCLDALVIESDQDGAWVYSITAANDEGLPIAEILERYKDRAFKSARHAVLSIERDINRELYINRDRV